MTDKKRWTGYYDAVANSPARKSLVSALEQWETIDGKLPGFAIDLGCGSGRDTFELLSHGWSVLAIDQEAEAIRRLTNKLSPAVDDRLTTQIARFESLDLPQSQLVNASFSLPFCPPQHFDALWQQIIDSLDEGGLFVGQLFGDRDSWAQDGGMTFHSHVQVEGRFLEFDVIAFTEVDEDSSTATGREKHWHYFEVIAQKKA